MPTAYTPNVIGFQQHAIYQFSTKEFIYTPPLSVSPFDDRLDYIQYFNVILFRLNDPRNVPERVKTFRWAIELF
jgi:hypothetical protein